MLFVQMAGHSSNRFVDGDLKSVHKITPYHTLKLSGSFDMQHWKLYVDQQSIHDP
jgi:hypothetical protein